jgi:flavodoxin
MAKPIALVIYESFFGNTKEIAFAIAEGIREVYEVKTLALNEASVGDIDSISLLVVGAPTRGGQPSPEMYEFLKSIPKNKLKDVKVATFDTRFEKGEHGTGLKILMNVIGFAAEKIMVQLKKKGGDLATEPEGFFVLDKEGPLKPGEAERAKEWGKKLSL